MNKTLKHELQRINCLFSDMDAAYHQAAVRLGVSDSVSVIYYLLYLNDGCCLLQDIYRLSGISKQTVNSALRKLELEALVYLEQLDGKAKKVCATEKGKPQIYAVAEKIYQAEENTLRGWTDEELACFIAGLEKYNTLFRAELEHI